jgi:hypothetical protein
MNEPINKMSVDLLFSKKLDFCLFQFLNNVSYRCLRRLSFGFSRVLNP